MCAHAVSGKSTHYLPDFEEIQEISTTPISSLPDELLLNIINRLPLLDIPVVSLVCRHWHALSQDESLWRSLCEENQLGEKEEDETWQVFAINSIYTFERAEAVRRIPLCSIVVSESAGIGKRLLPFSFRNSFRLFNKHHLVIISHSVTNEAKIVVQDPHFIYCDLILTLPFPIVGAALKGNVLAIVSDSTNDTYNTILKTHLIDLKQMEVQHDLPCLYCYRPNRQARRFPNPEKPYICFKTAYILAEYYFKPSMIALEWQGQTLVCLIRSEMHDSVIKYNFSAGSSLGSYEIDRISEQGFCTVVEGIEVNNSEEKKSSTLERIYSYVSNYFKVLV